VPLPLPPEDLEATRAAIVAKELVVTASGYLTSDVAMALPFEVLGPFKRLLLQFFSPAPWTQADAGRLSGLVAPHLAEGWWQHDLGSGITLAHGIRDGSYLLHVTGGSGGAPSIFDRVFDGPVVPEATPHPRKVKFATGGEPAPGRWYRRGDAGVPDDDRVRRLFAEPDVTDVMVAGNFVTVGIRSSWERRLEPLLALVTELFADAAAPVIAPERTRDELLAEAGSLTAARPEELHLLDPDDPPSRDRLLGSLASPDARVRRVAVAVLAESAEHDVRLRAVSAGLADPARPVRRTAVDAAADAGDETLRGLFESLLDDGDPWIRWKATRAIGELGVAESRTQIESLRDDPDFQVRFEANRVLRT
jgi:HEAT repeat protein